MNVGLNANFKKFDEICRFCLTKFCSSHTRFLIYGTNIGDQSLEDILIKFFQIEVKPNDNLPQHICTDCIFSLGQIYNFYELCHRSRQTLAALLAKGRTEPEEDKINTENISKQLEPNPGDNSDVNNSIKSKKGQPLQCTHCDSTFSSYSQYQKHKKIHILEEINNSQSSDNPEEKPEPVENNNVTNSSPDLSFPLKRDAKGLLLECAQCNTVFSTHYQYRKHKKAHGAQENNITEEKNEERPLKTDSKGHPLECKHCNVIFPSNYQYKKHKTTHENVHGCPLCQKKFKSISGLNVHLKTHNNNRLKRDNIGRQIECEICRIVCSSYHTYRMHKYEKHAEGLKPHVCPHCGRDFLMFSRLKNHLYTHTNEKPFLCASCPRQFKNQFYLDLHVKNVHTEEPPGNDKVKCTKCDRFFDSLKKMRSHRTTHITNSYLCPICGVSIARKYHYLGHVRRHTGERPFKCRFCDKGFVSRFRLNYHMNTHTKEKPYACKICGKGFASPARVQAHKKVHVKGLHKCTYCNKNFMKEINLKMHLMIHQSEDLFDDEQKFQEDSNEEMLQYVQEIYSEDSI